MSTTNVDEDYFTWRFRCALPKGQLSSRCRRLPDRRRSGASRTARSARCATGSTASRHRGPRGVRGARPARRRSARFEIRFERAAPRSRPACRRRSSSGEPIPAVSIPGYPRARTVSSSTSRASWSGRGFADALVAPATIRARPRPARSVLAVRPAPYSTGTSLADWARAEPDTWLWVTRETVLSGGGA